MADSFGVERKRKALSMAKLKGTRRDPSTKGKANAVPQAMNRTDKARGMAFDRFWNKRGVSPKANMAWSPNPSATIDKKSKVQYGEGN